jgi:hypothetical protein
VPLLPPRLAGERDTRRGCWGGGGGCWGGGGGGGGPRLLVLALVLDCNETGLSESRSRFAVDGLAVGRGRSPTDASS